MRRVIAFALVLGLLGALSAAPAFAKKKKPPITFKASGAFQLGHPASLNGATVTGNEFTNACAIPASQGVDGFVVELDDAISKVNSTVLVTGSDSTGSYDLDMYFYDSDCGSLGEASTEMSDEYGAFPAGTKYVFVTAFIGAQVTFELEATEIKG